MRAPTKWGQFVVPKGRQYQILSRARGTNDKRIPPQLAKHIFIHRGVSVKRHDNSERSEESVRFFIDPNGFGPALRRGIARCSLPF